MPSVSVYRRVHALVALALALAFVVLSADPTAGRTRFEYEYPVIGHSGYAHKHSRYPASDIIAKCGLPVVSPVNGVVLELSRENLWGQGIRNGSTRGGKFVSIKGNDGVRYYGSHLSRVADGLKPGVRVSAGQEIGKVGRTGRAGSCHLHFGISPVCAGTGDWWIRRGVVWPWPYLDSWRKKPRYHRSPRHEVADWLAANGCPSAP
jgi:murein DD-endopeptidase MepM/ murein hydrolase activator NlpD